MSEKTYVYAGTWTVQAKGVKGGGIGIYEYHPADGSLAYLKTVRQDIVAGKLCIDEERGVLYTTDETIDSPFFDYNGGGGRVVTFKIDPDSGDLRELGPEQPTFGTLPVYLALDKTRRWLIVCNHSDKQVVTGYTRAEDGKYHVTTHYSIVTAAAYPVQEDGALGDATDVVPFYQDRTVHPPQNACLHYVGFAGDGKHLIMTNMKQDMLLMYDLDTEKGRLIECDRIYLQKGSFPHYGVFHPTRRLFYLNYEHAHIFSTVAYDDAWRLTVKDDINVAPTLDPTNRPKKVLQTDVIISKDGQHLYDLYRGPNHIWVLALDANSGLPVKQQEFSFPENGNPRGGAISPDGKYLLIADTDNHLLRTLMINSDGTLTDTGLSDGHLQYPGNLLFYSAQQL